MCLFQQHENLGTIKKLWQQPEQESSIFRTHGPLLIFLFLCLHWSSAVVPTVTGCGTSLDSCGTECSPMSWGTDCGPRREDTSDRWGTRSVCSSAGRISRERRFQSSGGRGKSPSHWHLSKASGGISWALIIEVLLPSFLPPTYRRPRTAEPPSDSAGRCHWSRSFHWRSHSLA